jgi:hypothetical protein
MCRREPLERRPTGLIANWGPRLAPAIVTRSQAGFEGPLVERRGWTRIRTPTERYRSQLSKTAVQIESLVLRPSSKGDGIRTSIPPEGAKENWPTDERHTRIVQELRNRLDKLLWRLHIANLRGMHL